MISWFEALVLGIVQGLTEFLPVSSSAHVFLVSKLFGWGDPGAAFTAVTQIGTELAVLVYFRNEIWHLLRTIYRWFTSRRHRATAESKMAWAVVWGSLPIGVVGFAFQDLIERDVRNLQLVASMLIVFGILLVVVERFELAASRREMGFGVGLAMGFAQVLALIPGVSRSGATITAGLFLGLERRQATRYAFLLAIPAVLGSGFYEAAKIQTGAVSWGPTLLATATAFVLGLGVIAGLLNFLQRHSFTVFGLYRIILGAVLLVGLAGGWIA